MKTYGRFVKKTGNDSVFRKRSPESTAKRTYFVSKTGVATLSPATESFVGIPAPVMELNCKKGRGSDIDHELDVIEAVAEEFSKTSNGGRVASAIVTPSSNDNESTALIFGVSYDNRNTTAIPYKDAVLLGALLAEACGKESPAVPDKVKVPSPSLAAVLAGGAVAVAVCIAALKGGRSWKRL